MRYRIYFNDDHPPVEVSCYELEVLPNKKNIRTWNGPRAGSGYSVDLYFTETIESIKDDHGRLVWPAAAAAQSREPSQAADGKAQ